MHPFVLYASEFIDILSKTDILKDLIVVINSDGTVSGFKKLDDFYLSAKYSGEWKSYKGIVPIDLSEKIKPTTNQISCWCWQYYEYCDGLLYSGREGWKYGYPTNDMWKPFKNKNGIETVYSTSLGYFVREDDRTIKVEDKDIFLNIN